MLTNKIELTEYSLDILKDELPLNIINKLESLKGKSFQRYDEFKLILHGLLEDQFSDYASEILDHVEQIESDEDTLDENDGQSGSIYPYDPTQADIDIREDPQTVYELVERKWERGLIKMPNFQRNYIWKIEQQSLFIESILLNFPLPPLYINKDTKGKYVIVDGRQRITTLRRFMKDEFSLSGLKAFPNLNGKNFSALKSLDISYQSRIEDKKLLVYLIQPTVPLEMVYDIFNRINTGGTQLERQEIRNCIFLGTATEFLQKLSQKEGFKLSIDYGISSNRAKDQEAILRFLSFRIFDYRLNYKNSMNDFVERAMKYLNRFNINDSEIIALEEEFDKSMRLTYDFFGRNNFRIPTNETRGRINIAVFETVAGYFASQNEEFLKLNKRTIKKNFKILIDNWDYLDAVRISTGDKKRVSTRFDLVFDTLNAGCKNL
ncbi:hypothetical protein APR41_06840 [Salegentibacter salinarum]|uniref:GmrSD restriction endonucleases N-terminal domain-containing protein n=1 Tax=Salegentibacter salinarum TaxID=447422 RepID=A0A2N0TQX5_9FLAO|nr:DUF262 domain-containing protein [Salegentibacter salinarum]PKD17144.1 hypothetical protein APR41_06840 [Salegentibacter salinarum]SKB55600.1 Protein of unknown function DUF262 [Salegentibacter salinarum]